MKHFLGMLILGLAIMFMVDLVTGCKDQPKSERADYEIVGSGFSVEVIAIWYGGHQYISTSAGGLCHSASCTNAVHK